MTETDFTNDSDGEDFLNAVEKLAENIDGEVYAEVVGAVAARYAKLGFLDHAVQLAEKIPDPFARENALAEVATVSISTGNSDYADEILQTIDDPGIRSTAIEETAVKLAEQGDFDKALEVINQLDDADPALRRIAIAEGNPQAVELTHSISAPDLRASALGQLAVAAHRADRKSEATDLLEESLSASEEIEFSQDRIYALIGIASVYEEIGDTDRALELLSESLELCDDFEGMPVSGLPSSFPLGEVLTQIVDGFSRLGHFDKADGAAEQIEDPFQFARASSKEAVHYFKAGQTEQALTLLSEALELVVSEPAYGEQGVWMKDSVLAELAVAYTIAGQIEKGLQVTKKLSTEAQRNVALELVGKQCARMGNTRGVSQVAESLTRNYSSYWLGIADVLKESGESNWTPQALLKAEESAATLENNYDKALALIEVAYRFASTDTPGKATTLFDQALNTITQIDDDKKAIALLRMDDRFRQLNRKPDAAERNLLEQIGA